MLNFTASPQGLQGKVSVTRLGCRKATVLRPLFFLILFLQHH